MESVLTVISKVGVMLVMIAVGFVLTKTSVVTEKGASQMNAVLIRVVTPCLIISSLLSNDKGLSISDIALAILMPSLSITICILISYLFFKKETADRKKVLRFALIFGNVGFMGLPLIQGVTGAKGVVYGSFFVTVFNIFCWTYGYRMMNSSGKLDLKTILLNPGIIGLGVGLPLYFFSVPLPAVIREPIDFFADLNTPLAMLVVGSFIAGVDFKTLFTDPAVLKVSFLRLIAAPLLFFPLLFFVRESMPLLFVTCAIQSACPVAANTTLFAVQYGGDSALASKAVAVSTVLSALTLPLITVLAQLQ